MIKNITFYGSETDISGSYSTKTAVAALSGVASVEYAVLTINGQPDFEFDETEYLGGAVKSNVTKKDIFKPELQPIPFPTNSIDLDTFYGSDVLAMPYLWVDLNDYKIRAKNLDTTYVIKVALTGFDVEHDAENGVKKIKLELKAR